ncbi:MAG: hypothetical protein HY791_36980 [Deltaproteobacteria bacterium]|nr:hypothetical protein [Deltaproteobacteria bacterium]
MNLACVRFARSIDVLFMDTDGHNCAVGQSGKIWYVTGSFGGGPITRSCTIPSGKGLFLPILNIMSIPDGVPPPPVEQVRKEVNDWIEGSGVVMSVTVDGVEVPDLFAYRRQSPRGGTYFDVRPGSLQAVEPPPWPMATGCW